MNALLELSITGAVIALVIMIIRAFIQKRVSRIIIYGMWMILLVHLVIPVHMTSEISIFNYIETPGFFSVSSDEPAASTTTGTYDAQGSNTDSYKAADNNAVSMNELVINNEINGQQDSTELTIAESPDMMIESTEAASIIPAVARQVSGLDLKGIFSNIWLVVSMGLGLTILFIQLRLSRKMNESTIYIEHRNIVDDARKRIGLKRSIKIYSSAQINTPLVYGIIKPRIILPIRFANHCSEDQLAHVLTHELIHIKRLDYIVKPISLALLIIHWFNPILWISYILAQKDMEMSCDERVISAFDEDIRASYATSLVNLAEDHNHFANTVTLAFGENSIKSRVKGIMTSKNRVRWISALVVLLLIPLAVVLLTDKSSEEDSLVVPEGEAELVETIDENVSETTEEYDQALETLINDFINGDSVDSIKENHMDEYQLIMTSQFSVISIMQERLDSAVNSIGSSEDVSVELAREKGAIEWLISDIIKSQAEGSDHIRSEHAYTIVTSEECYGRVAPDTSSDSWVTLPKNSVVHITGFYNMDWMQAKIVVPQSLDINENNLSYMNTDQVEFWVNSEDLSRNVRSYNDIWGAYDNSEVAYSYVDDFRYIVNEDVVTRVHPVTNERQQLLSLQMTPDALSRTIGYLETNDLVAVKKDEGNQEIRQNGWVLVGQFNQGYDSSTVGWIEEKYIEPLTEDATPNQGFILRGTEAYENTDGSSSSEFIEFYEIFIQHSGMQPIRVLERQDGFIQFEDYGNTVRGWVKAEDVIFRITDEVEKALYWPDPNAVEFIEHFKSELLENPSFTLEAKDAEVVLSLTDDEKAALADSLTSVDDFVRWEGGLSPNREAAYPYHSLDFGDYSMVITWDDQLLLLMDKDHSYDYGIGSESSSVRWVTLNQEFLEAVKALIPVPPSNDPQDLNYLFNAAKVSIYNSDGELTASSDEQVHINKCIRAIERAMGEEFDGVISTQPEEETDRYEFEYTYEDGSKITVTHTNLFIYAGGKYYEPLEQPRDLQGGLFAGYF